MNSSDRQLIDDFEPKIADTVSIECSPGSRSSLSPPPETGPVVQPFGARGRPLGGGGILDGSPPSPTRFDDLEQWRGAAAGLDLLRPGSPDSTFIDAASPSSSRPVAGIVGDFRLRREIGRGGMGIVYEAEQMSLRRRVALKILPFAGICAPRELQRFLHEARAAASLQHSNIVPVYAVGCDHGLHFYAMQYIEGCSLAALISSQRQQVYRSHDSPTVSLHPVEPASPGGRTSTDFLLPEFETGAVAPQPSATFRQIAEWGVQIAQALDYAHRLGIVHRDIKPGNILLDQQGQIWVTDFGLAQMASSEGLTVSGDLIGTLRYMSPEQATGGKGLLDARADVYSLGATLYELLTLRPLFGGSDRAELLQKIVYEEPVSLRKLNPSVPLELATIVHKALERELSARYATAGDMADDLQRFLDERPIAARPPSVLDRLGKWARRNRGTVRTAALFTSAILVILLIAALLINRERQNVRLERQQQAGEIEQARVVQRALAANRYVTQINLADRSWHLGQFDETRRLLSEQIGQDGGADLRDFEWRYLWHAAEERNHPIGRHDGMAYCVRRSPDGTLLATGGQDGIRLWDAISFKPRGRLLDHQTDVNGIDFSADGKWMVSAGDDDRVRIWSTADWQMKHVIPHGGNVVAAMFVPGRDWIVTAERREIEADQQRHGENVVRVWDMQDWACVRTLQHHDAEISSLDVSADGNLIATGSSDGTACVWDLAADQLRHRISYSPSSILSSIHCVKFARHAPWLATSGDDGTVRLWNTVDRSLVTTLLGPQKPLEFVVFSDDDQTIAAGGRDTWISVWHWHPVVGSRRHADLSIQVPAQLWGAKFLDEFQLVTTGRDGAIRCCDLRKLPDRQRIPEVQGGLADITFSPDGKYLLSCGKGVRVYRVRDGARIHELAAPSREFTQIAVVPDGTRVFALAVDGALVEWSMSLEFDPLFSHATPLPESQNWKMVFWQNALYLLDQKRQRCLAFDSHHDLCERAMLPGLAAGDRTIVAPNSQAAAVLKSDGRLQIWRLGAGLWHPPGFTGEFDGGSFSGNGECLILHSPNGSIRTLHLNDISAGSRFLVPVPSLAAVSHDGRTIATRARHEHKPRHENVTLWNVATGRQLLELDTGCNTVVKLIFAPDGNRLAALARNTLGVPEIAIWTAEGSNFPSSDQSLREAP